MKTFLLILNVVFGVANFGFFITLGSIFSLIGAIANFVAAAIVYKS